MNGIVQFGDSLPRVRKTTKWDDPPSKAKSNKALYNSEELAYYRDSAKKSGDIYWG